jgi:hypothetical protein
MDHKSRGCELRLQTGMVCSRSSFLKFFSARSRASSILVVNVVSYSVSMATIIYAHSLEFKLDGNGSIVLSYAPGPTVAAEMSTSGVGSLSIH